MQAGTSDNKNFAESEIVIKDTKIRLKSVFSEKTNLNTAIKNIVTRKITLSKNV